MATQLTQHPSSNPEPARGRGRPTGSYKVVESAVAEELAEQIKFNRDLRRTAKDIIKRMTKLSEQQHDNLDAQIKALDAIESCLLTSAKSIEVVAKHVQNIEGASSNTRKQLDAPRKVQSAEDLIAGLDKE